ncbi:MAG TPA: IclR family transcriptional regulator [Pseudonocardia sp.]|nr:IclR family transcriptional regulator [Pseudonocardia sp.]
MTEQRTPRERGEGVRSVVRAVEILSLFDAAHRFRTLRELVAATGLPKTTVVRLLATLQDRGLVAGVGETTYILGPVLLRWVRLAQTVWEVNSETRDVMRRLVDETGETANVYVRQDDHRVSIAQEAGTATVRSVVEVGRPMPLNAGATAKVLLGAVPAEHLGEILSDLDGAALSALQRQVASTLETGYAITHGERELGASAIAAPIRDPQGRIIAALSISGPTSRFTADRVVRCVAAVTQAAEEISTVRMGSVEALL